MNVAIAYDCLYPLTIGGAEKWYRSLGEALAPRHRVTFLTRRQWATREPPSLGRNLEAVAVCGRRALYTADGRRRLDGALAYGLGLLAHLVRHRSRYDVIHVASVPFFSVLTARAVEARRGLPVVVDWLEVLSREGWRSYLGPVAGPIGVAVQGRCIRASFAPVVHARLHAARLVAEGCPGAPMLIRGLYAGPLSPPLDPGPREPLVVFAGRHVPHKGVSLIPEAVARARRRVPGLRAILFGDGPGRAGVQAEIRRLGLGGVVQSVGVAAESTVRDALGRASCLVLPSQREGFGLVVVEAAAMGTPAVVLRGPDSAADELIDEGENGLVIENAAPEPLADALVAIHADGPGFLARTAAWFRRHAPELAVDASVVALDGLYRRVARGRAAPSRPS